MDRVACVTAEVRALGELYDVDAAEIDAVVTALAPHLGHYAELVLGETGFEVITGGVGNASSLSSIAARFGALPEAMAAFEACAAAFPDRMLGLKLELGPTADGPTLYVRTMTEMESGLGFLASLPRAAAGVPALRDALVANRTLYGLGFSGADSLVVKTYTIDDVGGDSGAGRSEAAPGFRSLRLDGGTISAESKRYLPDVAWRDIVPPTPRWRTVVDFASGALGWRLAGHFGLASRNGRAPELKLYVERIGAIPTDYAAR